MRTRSPVVYLLLLAVCPQMFAADVSPDVMEDWHRQYRELAKGIEERSPHQAPEDQMLDRSAMILETDRNPLDIVLRRAEALLAHMRTMTDAPDLGEQERRLKLLMRRSQGGSGGEGMFIEVKRIIREALLANPLLDFDSILYVERKCVGPGNYDGGHMTTASFGHTQLYGGGLYIVRDFKSDRPVISNLVEGSIVESGRFKGEALAGGAYNSPELSFDAREVLFAYAKSVYSGTKRPWEYSEQNSFHLFRVAIDGSGLRQLTDGNHNDFDPCFLPGGRIAFVSTRTGSRGTGRIYPRCFKEVAPQQFLLCSMNADGSDIAQLSYHETDEWQPSVNNDGMLVYTRWDYVDRNSNAAQHLWTCFPDGRDPRAPHGNYVHPYSTMVGTDFGPGVFTTRPNCEWHIRSVPETEGYQGSSRYVATAGPHHGEPFGALVLIDTNLEDDGLMSQVRRITPNKFPESEVNSETSWDYATPWPLSENFYICNYRDGIYLLDRYGNLELICKARNPALRPVEPIPIKSRIMPPALPDQTRQADREASRLPPATVAVLNAYTTDLPFPEGTVLKELRIVQYFPKSTQDMFDPIIGYAEQSLARMVLGTVPVEEDGSVYFEAPVGKAISFQLIDQNGVAVQAMRSATYVHPGERLSCVGCHESKLSAASPGTHPMAMRRPPSKITPEVGGLEPLNFHRLVKPVLERKCAACHRRKNEAPDMSYASLKEYAFFLVGGKPQSGRWLTIPRHGGSRSVPGLHGAYGAPLLDYLDKTHHGVELTGEERRRITMWLDCNSNELGAYVNEDAQRRGELVWPVFDLDPDHPLGVEIRQAPGGGGQRREDKQLRGAERAEETVDGR